jgi:hypothetical protein
MRGIELTAPRECPIPINGMGIEDRKVLIIWRRSRAWSFHDANVHVNMGYNMKEMKGQEDGRE